MTSNLQSGLLLGTIVGTIPTVSMIIMSLFVFKMEVSKSFEAMAQNLCAGLIIGAVGKELFPQLGDFSEWDDVAGLSIGFVCGFLLINYQESLEECFEELYEYFYSVDAHTQKPKKRKERSMSNDEEKKLLSRSHSNYKTQNGIKAETGSESGIESESENETDAEVGEHPILLLGSQVIASPSERSRVREQVADLVRSVQNMQSKAQSLFTSSSTATSADAEILADQIDEEIHKLHYILDHSRRLLQGSGSSMEGVVPRIWITERGKKALQKGLEELHEGATRVVTCLDKDDLSRGALITIHDTLGNMDDHISRLHNTVENYSLKWGRRLKKRVILIPSTGSYIPMDLLIPVVVDCIMDGFLLGTTASFSPRAGFILSAANCIEMGFLGMAVSMRVQKCTSSSLCARYASLIVPPLIMLGAAVAGSFLGILSQKHPILYVSFICFGMVALLYLALNELLVEAREAIKGEESWYSGLVVFAGIYIVMVMDLFLPV